jgi:hypothetical protein
MMSLPIGISTDSSSSGTDGSSNGSFAVVHGRAKKSHEKRRGAGEGEGDAVDFEKTLPGIPV